jgi:Helix-loop-helix DNA-binding domain
MSGTDRPAQSLPSLAPAISSLTADATPPADDADLTPDVPGPKRRGRKPSTLSRAARESMRRQNHSRIEKARRTKINDALATLRNLVPADAGRKLPSLGDESPDEDDEDDEFGFGNSKTPGSKSKQKQEKEFKLEILEKAVLYVQELQEKVRVLEARGCARCSNVVTSPVHHPKRKHEAMPSSDDYDSNSSDVVTDRPMKRLSSTQSIHPPIQSTRLPSISSWLPLSMEQDHPESRTPLVNPVQLPTPPASVVIVPVSSPQVPPSLRLELPVASLSTKNHPASTQSSPSWSPEDESVASLLLRIKTSGPPKAGKHGASVSDLLAPTPGAPGIGGGTRFRGVDDVRAQTPGSLLGMTTDGPK